MVDNDLKSLAQCMAVSFNNLEILSAALIHRSYCAENPEIESNERLEFLGDAVLGMIVTDYIYAKFPLLPEGSLSEVRAGVVNAKSLAELAEELNLGRFLALGKGEDQAGGRQRPSILADTMEAVIAAVYLDAGWEQANDFVLGLLAKRIEIAAELPGSDDFKTRLQELVAARGLGRPRYEVQDSGPDHDKLFFAKVFIDDGEMGEGEDRTKKGAEQIAAREAADKLRES